MRRAAGEDAVQRVPRRVVLLARVPDERVGRAQEGVQEGAKEGEEMVQAPSTGKWEVQVLA